MKINARLLREMRVEQSWSQEEMAIAAGLNIRTVQRIERDATASLQSRKALASVFDIDVRDLDCEDQPMNTCYEYKTLEIEPKETFLTGLKRAELPDLAGLLNAEGKQGWRLVEILTPDIAQGVWVAKSGRLVVLLERSYNE